MSARGLLVVVSGPSGVGKTSVAQRLLRAPRFARAVTATTRAPRPGEVAGRDYLFLDEADFRARVARGEFLEHAEVHGRLYGTPRESVEAILRKGLVCLLVIDVQGAGTLRKGGVDALFLFLEPPSKDELRRRLAARATDPPAEVARRLRTAEAELAEAGRFDARVVNDDLERAVSEVESLVSARARQAGAP